MVQRPPPNWKVVCSIHSHWVNHRRAPWSKAFTATALTKSIIQVSACRQLSLNKSVILHAVNLFYFCIANTIGIPTDNLLHMLCLVIVFRCLMQLQNEYSVMLLLRSRSGKVVILDVFKTDINIVSFLPAFKLCSWCFYQSSGDSGQWLSGLARVIDYDIYCRTWACLLCIFVPPPSAHWSC